jgi:hypothetical protein
MGWARSWRLRADEIPTPRFHRSGRCGRPTHRRKGSIPAWRSSRRPHCNNWSRSLSWNPMRRLIIVMGTTLPIAAMKSTDPSLRAWPRTPRRSLRRRVPEQPCAWPRVQERPCLDAVRASEGLPWPALGLPHRRTRADKASLGVFIQEAVQIGRKVLHSGSGFSEELECGHREDPSAGYFPHRRFSPQLLVEPVRLSDHGGVEQVRSGDLGFNTTGRLAT